MAASIVDGIYGAFQGLVKILKGLAPEFMAFLEEMLDPSLMLDSFFTNIPDAFDEYLPDSLLEMKKAAQVNASEKGIPKYHEGGIMSGPGIIKNDEYVLIPPKGASPASVATPQQVKMGSDNTQQPVTVVINVDGREFVRQTVMPALNKEFKLQGIG